MKPTQTLAAFSLFALGTVPSSALVIVLSDLVPAGPTGALESFFNNNFSNVTEIRHGDYANFGAAGTQDALNGTGAFAGGGAADVVVIGRSLSSGGYDNGDADGYNGIAAAVVNLTSYTARNSGNRMGWHGSAASSTQLIAGDETTVTAAGGTVFGVAAGAYDFLVASDLAADTFNGLGVGSTTYGDGQILATVGGDTLAAYWAAGDAPGDTVSAGVATFGGPRLLFNIDNDPNAGNNGINDLANMSPAGLNAMISAIDFATPLTSVPEPSSALLSLVALGFLARRRR